MIKILEYRHTAFLLLLSLLFASGCSDEVKNSKDEIVGVWLIDKDNVYPKGTKPPGDTDLLRLVIRPDNTFTAYNVPAKFFFKEQIQHYEKLNGAWGLRDYKDGYTYIDLRWSDQNGFNGVYGLTLGYKYSKVYLYQIIYSGHNLCFLRISKDASVNMGKIEKNKAQEDAIAHPKHK